MMLAHAAKAAPARPQATMGGLSRPGPGPAPAGGGRKNEADPDHRRRRLHRLAPRRRAARAGLPRARARQPLRRRCTATTRRGPRYLAPEVELIVGDVRDPRRGAARARRRRRGLPPRGRGRRRPEHVRDRATTPRVNNLGTAVLLEALIDAARSSGCVVASSMSIYGEGLYRDAGRARCVEPPSATLEQLAARRLGARDGRTARRSSRCRRPRRKPPALDSVYALRSTTRSGCA